MGHRKKTLRRMVVTERKYARLLGELESVVRRLKNFQSTVREQALLWEATVRAQKQAEIAEQESPEGESEIGD